ncbi:MAG: pyridoxal phosphate-dependent aminotransferase [Betaproteobacteria bacterium]|nr:pyridoxal phosphate-dependent aminotransferase [Betaproteobacteria bacterium]
MRCAGRTALQTNGAWDAPYACSGAGSGIIGRVKPEKLTAAARRLHLARRMADIEPFHVMEVLSRARELEAQGRSIIHMEIGEPDFATPRPVVEAGIRALEQGDIHYTPALGLPQLRQAIAAFYRTRYGVSVSPSRVVVTPGSSGALLLAMGVLLNPGDQVLMADPGYPCNRHFVRFTEGEAVGIPVDAQSNYQLTAERVAERWTPRAVAAMLASPSNPTGALVPERELSAIFECVQKRGGRLIVDEIYHGLTYGIEAKTALALSDDILVINSFSKYFNMTGWRLGWLVAPEALVRELEKLAQNLFISAPTASQRAALAAFTPENIAILEERREEFCRRRDFLLPALRDLGFDIPVEPQGAFYLYAGCSRFAGDSQRFALDVLEQAGVAITPGLDFGANAPQHHVRFAYTTSLENLREGVRRIGEFVRRG